MEGSKLITTTDAEHQITKENIRIINAAEKNEDDSDDAKGEIGDDRLDTNGAIQGDSLSTETAAGLFKKLLSINQVEKMAEAVDGNKEDDEESVITPTRILNGRQVCFHTQGMSLSLSSGTLIFVS